MSNRLERSGRSSGSTGRVVLRNDAARPAASAIDARTLSDRVLDLGRIVDSTGGFAFGDHMDSAGPADTKLMYVRCRCA
jgi:hypothetical protein